MTVALVRGILARMSGPPYISLFDLQLATGLPFRWLDRAAKDGRIPSIRIGRRLFFDLDAVRAALASRADQKATPDSNSTAAPLGGFRKPDENPVRRPTGEPLPSASGFRPGHKDID